MVGSRSAITTVTTISITTTVTSLSCHRSCHVTIMSPFMSVGILADVAVPNELWCILPPAPTAMSDSTKREVYLRIFPNIDALSKQEIEERLRVARHFDEASKEHKNELCIAHGIEGSQTLDNYMLGIYSCPSPTRISTPRREEPTSPMSSTTCIEELI